MQVYTFGRSVIGAAHIRSGTVCQDSFLTATIGKNLILSVADGHGSAAAEFSHDGSRIAAEVFCRVMAEYAENYKESLRGQAREKLSAIMKTEGYQSNTDRLIHFLNREGQTKVAQTISEEWKKSVAEYHEEQGREDCLNEDGSFDEALLLRKYGSTLLGLFVSGGFVFAYQLGDGDIVRIDDNAIETLVESEKLLGVETHSIGKPASWQSAHSKTMRIDKKGGLPYAYILTSDGFSNSYPSEEEFRKALRGYFDAMKEHGAQAVEENLEGWLAETSEKGCGDDITMVASYYSE